MICSACGQHDARVLDSRRVFQGSVIKRTRGCICGAKFQSYEINGAIWNTVKKWAVASNLVAQRKRHILHARNEAIADQLRSGVRAQDVAKDFGLSPEMVSTIRKRAGLPPARKDRRGQQWFQV